MIRTPFIIGFIISLCHIIPAQSLIINELMSDNESTLQDNDGEYSDWVELYNSSTEAISLANYYLSDDNDSLKKWTLPNIILQPDSFLVVFASGKDLSYGTEWHTNFKISSEGEKIYLSDYQGSKVEKIEKFSLGNDQSAGKNQMQENVILDQPTPGKKNISYNNILNSNKLSGTYTAAFALEISGENTDPIFYTTDGQDPNPGCKQYSNGINIENRTNEPLKYALIPTTPDQGKISYKAWSLPKHTPPMLNTIKFQSYKDGLPTSPMYTQVFLIGQKFTDLYELPVLSLVVDSLDLFAAENGIYVTGVHLDPDRQDWTGNYFKKGHNWERNVSLDYFVNDAHVLSEQAGIRINGNYTRHAAQKSLRLLARKKYGSDRFDYPFIETSAKEHYHSFILRTPMGSWFGKNLIKDELIQEICKDLNFESMDYSPTMTYLNGEFWGIYNIRDHINEKHLSQVSGISQDSIEMWNWYNWHYHSLISYIKENDLQLAESYNEIGNRLDLSNFIDYQIAQVFFQNKDWPGNNNSFWRPKTSDGKWRWIFFDLDATMILDGKSTLEHSITNDESNNTPLLFRKLLENPQFKEQFIDRYFELLETTFSAENMLVHYKELQKPYDTYLDLQMDRWNLPVNRAVWEEDLIKVRNFLELRPCLAKEELVSYFELDTSYLCPPSPASLNPDGPFLIYPNPTEGNITIAKIQSEDIITQIEMHNSVGQLILNQKIRLLIKHEIDLSDYSAGLYVVTLIEDGIRKNYKIVIRK